MDSPDDKVLTDYGFKPDGSPFEKHPDEQHQFTMVCIKCGELGMVHIVLITAGDRVYVEPIDGK